jgi:hypothetical protein
MDFPSTKTWFIQNSVSQQHLALEKAFPRFPIWHRQFVQQNGSWADSGSLHYRTSEGGQIGAESAAAKLSPGGVTFPYWELLKAGFRTNSSSWIKAARDCSPDCYHSPRDGQRPDLHNCFIVFSNSECILPSCSDSARRDIYPVVFGFGESFC